jgi:putative ABC transport system permease protein
LSVATAGVLIVLMAAINFVNLMTARAGRRAAEVGVRKVAGAERADLIVQFIGEALVYAALGALIALAIAEIALPSFNAFLGRTSAFPYGVAVPVLLGLVLLIGILAGAYPALVLSRFRPAAALKGGLIQSSGSPALRQGMVAFQFAVLIGLIVATAVIWRQTLFATRDSLGLDTDQVLLIQAPCVPDGFKTELAALPGVAGVACSVGAPLGNTIPAKAASFQGREMSLFANSIGFGFFELYGLKPLAGRFFSPAYGGDATSAADDSPTRIESVVINESAARALGFARPADAVGKSFRWSHIKTMDGRYFQVHPANVIGVVEDFPMNTIRSRIEPTAFYVEPDQSSLINVRLNGHPTPETGKGLEGLARKYGFPAGLNFAFVTPILRSRYLDIRHQGQLFEIFSGLALFIACLGLVGLAAFATEQRTKEVGIRKAMGAGRFDILKLFLWQFTVPVASANLIAWPFAFVFVTRWLQGFAYRIELTVWPFAAAAVMAVCIAWLTVMSLALKAAKARPVNALRYE